MNPNLKSAALRFFILSALAGVAAFSSHSSHANDRAARKEGSEDLDCYGVNTYDRDSILFLTLKYGRSESSPIRATVATASDVMTLPKDREILFTSEVEWGQVGFIQGSRGLVGENSLEISDEPESVAEKYIDFKIGRKKYHAVLFCDSLENSIELGKEYKKRKNKDVISD
jgi:hypothetical protein